MAPRSGPVLPPPAADLAGRPGRLYAKLLTDFDGRAPVPFWRPAREPIDTRLTPGVNDEITLATLDPQIAVISVGQPNPYGHPDPNALAELDQVGAQIWRTDQHGTITIAFTGQGPVVASER